MGWSHTGSRKRPLRLCALHGNHRKSRKRKVKVKKGFCEGKTSREGGLSIPLPSPYSPFWLPKKLTTTDTGISAVTSNQRENHLSTLIVWSLPSFPSQRTCYMRFPVTTYVLCSLLCLRYRQRYYQIGRFLVSRVSRTLQGPGRYVCPYLLTWVRKVCLEGLIKISGGLFFTIYLGP